LLDRLGVILELVIMHSVFYFRSNVTRISLIVIIRNRCGSANDSAYSYTFLHSVVGLSVVCHIRAPCLNRSIDLDALFRVRWHVV